jgi:predicted dinucleotide-binding enzyme
MAVQLKWYWAKQRIEIKLLADERQVRRTMENKGNHMSRTDKAAQLTKPGTTDMKIGIIGAGAIGSAFARALARVGIGADISNSRGSASLASLVQEIGPTARAVEPAEAARADIVLVAVNWSKLPAALASLPEWAGRIVIDANNPLVVEGDQLKRVDLNGRLSSEVFSELAPGARVVKAFNHLPAASLSGDPKHEGGRRVLFFSGDDAEAKSQVGALIGRLGFFGIDLGPLSTGARLAQPGGPLSALNLVKFD